MLCEPQYAFRRGATILWAHFSGHSSLNQALASELLEVKAQLSTKLEVVPVNASGLLTTDAQFVGRRRCLRSLRGQCPVEHQASGGAVNASGLWETNTQLGASALGDFFWMR